MLVLCIEALGPGIIQVLFIYKPFYYKIVLFISQFMIRWRLPSTFLLVGSALSSGTCLYTFLMLGLSVSPQSFSVNDLLLLVLGFGEGEVADENNHKHDPEQANHGHHQHPPHVCNPFKGHLKLGRSEKIC